MRATTIVIASSMLFAGLAVAAEPVHPHVPGRIIAKLAPAEVLPGADAAPLDVVPAWLASYGVRGMSPLLSAGNGRLSKLARRIGLDRLLVLDLPAAVDVARLASLLEREEKGRIEYAHPDWIGEGGTSHVVPADTAWTNQWALNNTGQGGGTIDADIDAAEAWRTATGRREIVVAVLDTGVDGDHPALRGRIGRAGRDEVNTDFDPEGDHSHGTLVSGILGANANDRFSVAGIDWRSTMLTIKVLNANNSGATTDLIDGINYAAEQGADVTNMSLIRYPNTGAMQDAATFADDAGVVQIGCNGNDGNSVLNYPASYAEVLATGWTTDDDVRSSSSNFTSTLDVMAPGSGTRTIVYGSTADTSTQFSGCSAATPHVVGIVSVLLALDPTLTFTQVRDLLRATADDEVGPPFEDVPGRDDYYGWGRVSMQQAFDALGIVSRDTMHVDGIVLEQVSNNALEVRVVVLDELTGVEEGAFVQGTLTLPDTSTQPLSATTASNGEAVMTWQPGGPLPNGEWTFAVDAVSKAGLAYEAASNFETSRSYDPDLDGLHVGAIRITDDFDDVLIEVLVLDDDGVPTGNVTVDLDLDVPSGPNQNFSNVATWAAGGWARFTHTEPSGADPGAYLATVTSLTRSGFTYQPARNVVSSLPHTVFASNGDEDSDGVQNGSDNCIATSNAGQADADSDGFGDACDTCTARVDPAQRDTDGDGTGNRCDCAPFDASTADLSAVWGVRLDADAQTLRWNGIVGADRYDITRGLASALDGSDYGACLSDDAQGTALAIAAAPPAGDAYFFLVRGDDAICAPGPLEDASAGPRVNANPSACGP